jgi:hypothetical protein
MFLFSHAGEFEMGGYMPVISLIAMILGTVGAGVAVGVVIWAFAKRKPPA